MYENKIDNLWNGKYNILKIQKFVCYPDRKIHM